MTEIPTINALRLLQAADAVRAGLAGEFSAAHGLSVNEFFMLLHLERAARHRLPRVELAKRMHVSASTITRMVAPLEKIGLLGRDADERDARLVFVVLTETGQARLAEAQTTFAKRAGYLFQDRWSPAELDRFAGLLQRLLSGVPEPLA
ncbi:MarR family winged helix-turn-helix transcriptional regulator [Dinoroseobacter sp. S375]|uniref:MarR family winged helix-turn-helix transcriptional regulator n=1 Tax=Dinoroseobacter sp. S375 TaxID=3415136 RepID=UPI003C7D3E4C